MALVGAGLAAGISVSAASPQTSAGVEGTSVLPARPAQVTFNRDVAPIMFRSCATCHRPGEAAPFSLLSYSDAKKHARQIVEVTRSRAMPPAPSR